MSARNQFKMEIIAGRLVLRITILGWYSGACYQYQYYSKHKRIELIQRVTSSEISTHHMIHKKQQPDVWTPELRQWTLFDLMDEHFETEPFKVTLAFAGLICLAGL